MNEQIMIVLVQQKMAAIAVVIVLVQLVFEDLFVIPQEQAVSVYFKFLLVLRTLLFQLIHSSLIHLYEVYLLYLQ